jgi:glycosyltransferase involved in cell wall biosynthesis
VTVAVDATYSLGPAPSGVAVYCSSLLRHVTRRAPADRFLLCYRANRFLRAWKSPKPAPNCARRLLEERVEFLFARQADVFHGLNQRLPRCKLRRAVTTFHDLFVMTGDYSTPEFRQRFTELARDAARRSDHIIAVSAFTASQIIELLGVPREKISVIHHGVEPLPEFPEQELDAFRRDNGVSKPFLLHIGAIQKRKNIARLIEAFERLPADFSLLLAGSAGYGSEEILQQVERSSARGRIHRIGYVDQGTLARLYRAATALAFPSLDEGFGLPVLEAMGAGLPVVTSDRSATAEIAGEAAVLVDPYDVESIHHGLQRVLTDQSLRDELRGKGLSRASGFRWESAADQTLAVYRQLA